MKVVNSEDRTVGEALALSATRKPRPSFSDSRHARRALTFKRPRHIEIQVFFADQQAHGHSPERGGLFDPAPPPEGD